MSRPAAQLVLFSALLLTVACDKVPLLAPTQSTITLSVDTTTVAVNGTAQVSAVVTEQSGTPVQNGTVVTFSTSLGSMDPPEARTDRGIARSTFRANGQSGVARITAFSGAARTSTEQQVEVRVGGAAAGRIAMRAEPANVPTSGGTTTIVATVFDASGNFLPGVPVSFSADAGSLSTSQSITDSNGEARTSLTTSRQTTVTASAGGAAGTGGGAAVTATFTVPVVSLPSVTIAPAAGALLEAGIPINFTVTPASGGIGGGTSNPLRDVIIDWGDGTQPTSLGAITQATNVAHTYANRGQYQLTATAIDTQGLRGSSSTVISVNDRGALQVSLSATPNPVSVSSPTQQGLVDFTATATPPAGTTIQSYSWDFGDGGGQLTNQSTINHRYSAPGTYIASVTVRATNGLTGYAERTIRVNP